MLIFYIIIFHCCLQILQSDKNTKIFEDLLNFVKGAYGNDGTKEYDSKAALIPTAALITGLKLY